MIVSPEAKKKQQLLETGVYEYMVGGLHEPLLHLHT